jgi:NADH-quinone oxidoreductase subunit N
MDWNHEMLWYGHMFHTTNTSISFSLIIQLAAFMVVSFSKGFGIDEEHTHPAEYYAILLFSVVGAILMVSFDHLIMFFVGLEILSVAMYVLTGSDKRNLRSNEAALKYFLMGSFATGILLFGITLVYGATRSFYLVNIAQAIANTPPESTPVFLSIGVLLILVGFLFKISAAPFHFWTPDVYDGSPTAFTPFMASIAKVAIFAAFIHLFHTSFAGLAGRWHIIIIAIIVLTLLIGNVTAVYQQSVKRMLAYSSIAQAGFLLFAVYSLNEISQKGILLYGASYMLATMSIFAVLIKMKDYTFDGFNGLAKKQPVIAFAAAIALFSLAGIPLTGGFFGKYYMLNGAMQNGMPIWVLIFAVLMAAISVYYYFKLIQAMYFKTSIQDATEPHAVIDVPFKVMLIINTALLILLGIYPTIVTIF